MARMAAAAETSDFSDAPATTATTKRSRPPAKTLAQRKQLANNIASSQHRSTAQKKIPDPEDVNNGTRGSGIELAPRSKATRAQASESQARRQRALKGTHANSLLRPFDDRQSKNAGIRPIRPERTGDGIFGNLPLSRQTPSRRAKRVAQYKAPAMDTEFEVEEAASSPIGKACDEVEGEDSYEDSCDEDSEDSIALIEFWSQRHPIPTPGRRRSPLKRVERSSSPSPTKETPVKKNEKKTAVSEKVDLVDLTSPSPPPKKASLPLHPFQPLSLLPGPNPRPGTSGSSDNDPAAILQFSPGKPHSPQKGAPRPQCRPATPPAITPPQSPSKVRLKSPSKTKDRIPHAPFRPSIDAFWSATVINEWNDQYSPEKGALASPRKKRFQDLLSADASSGSASDVTADAPVLPASPRKGSPTKKDPAVAKAKKEFDANKRAMADALLKELDSEITGGKISEMTASSGGVAIVWSKSLNKTAGRASWKRETVRKTGDDGKKLVTSKHIASIELAEKVIDDENKLVNTLAHEFCHLATFMISGVKDNPHGAEFKEWGRLVSKKFAHRNVKVTTKHNYEIDYKYVWECVSCGQEYKRHSKSIDPTKQSCGGCKSKLVQTKPAVRSMKVSEYQVFVKENYQRAKRTAAGGGHAAVMEVIGRMYRERKGATVGGNVTELRDTQSQSLDDVVRALDIVCLDD